MKISRLILYAIYFLHNASIDAVHFHSSQIPYLFSHEYFQLLEQGNFDFEKCLHKDASRLQQMQHNFLWHVKIPTLQFFPSCDEQNSQKLTNPIRVAVLDTNFKPKHFNLKKNSERVKKSLTLKDSSLLSQSVELVAKDSPQQTLQTTFCPKSLQKNHGAYTCAIIQQIAPQVEIILIPILNDHGFADKKTLSVGLSQALKCKADIVHLGLKIESFDAQDPQDQELLKLLQQCRYVVIASGNDAALGRKMCDLIGCPSIFFSVGAFEKDGDIYKISDFSQFEPGVGPNFVMPGKDVIVPIFSESIDDFVWIKTAGTSVAAALMTGCLAQLLAVNCSDFLTVEQMRYVAEKNSLFLHEQQWKNKVVFGTINLQASIFCLKVLNHLKSYLTIKKWCENFESFVDKIVERWREDNFFVKNKSFYADKSFSKKIDSKLRILVEHSINQVKESA